MEIVVTIVIFTLLLLIFIPVPDCQLYVAELLCHCFVKWLQFSPILINPLFLHLLVKLGTIFQHFQIHSIDCLYFLLQNGIFCFEIVSMLPAEDVSQFFKHSCHELTDFFEGVLVSDFVVLHHRVFSLKRAQSVSYIILCQKSLFIKLCPTYPFLWIILQHSFNHFLNLYWYAFVAVL